MKQYPKVFHLDTNTGAHTSAGAFRSRLGGCCEWFIKLIGAVLDPSDSANPCPLTPCLGSRYGAGITSAKATASTSDLPNPLFTWTGRVNVQHGVRVAYFAQAFSEFFCYLAANKPLR